MLLRYAEGTGDIANEITLSLIISSNRERGIGEWEWGTGMEMGNLIKGGISKRGNY